MINLKIDPEFQNQIPPLTDDEYKQLEENILKEGKLLSPLIVWNNTLVDGHNRYVGIQIQKFTLLRVGKVINSGEILEYGFLQKLLNLATVQGIFIQCRFPPISLPR